MKKDILIPKLVGLEGKRSPRPSDDRSRWRGLNDEIWRIIEICWAQDPSGRLSSEEIIERVRGELKCIDERPRDSFPTFPWRALYATDLHPFAVLDETDVS